MKILKFAVLVVITLTTVVRANAFIQIADPNASTEIQPELLAAAPSVSPYPIPDALPLEWESEKNPGRKEWSNYAYSVINQVFDQINQASDMEKFCPNYKTLTRDQQIQAWAQIFVGIAHWESSWDPTNDTYEGGGIDPATHKQSTSDGLLQVSYAEALGNPNCPFNYEADQRLPSHDVHRTIYNPYNNLHCGIHAMTDGIADNPGNPKHLIVASDEWSTLDPNDRTHSKIKSITAEVHNTLPFCGPHMGGSPLAEDFTRFANLRGNRDIVMGWRSTVGRAEDFVGKKLRKRHKQQSDAAPGTDQTETPAPPSDSASGAPPAAEN